MNVCGVYYFPQQRRVKFPFEIHSAESSLRTCRRLLYCGLLEFEIEVRVETENDTLSPQLVCPI